MKRQWRLRRQLQATPDGTRRWDQAYQHLLRWATLTEQDRTPVSQFCPLQRQEVSHEHCRLRAGVDPAPSPEVSKGRIEQPWTRLRAHIQAHGGELRDEDIFRDDGYSGATLNRPGLDRLRDAVRAAAVDRVLVTDPDRLARNYVRQMVRLEELEQFGCQVEFRDRPMSQDPHDQLLLQIRGAVAEYERTLIAERMRRGRPMKLRAGGLLPWTRTPYGYRVKPDRPRDPAGVRVEPVEAAVVQELFAHYLEEQASLFGLAKQLPTLGLTSPCGKQRWNPATIRGTLTNPAYTGQVYTDRTRSRAPRLRRSATHPEGLPSTTATVLPRELGVPLATLPALIGQEQFDRVQAKPVPR